MLKVDEIAKGLSVHRNTIINLIKKGDIKAFRVGDQYRVPEESLKNYLNTAGTANFDDWIKSQK